jgi:transposase-like protein
MMQCPECGSKHIRKNGKMRGKQNHICVDCHRQFIDVYSAPQGYSNAVKAQCLKMSVNSMGFRAIERVTGVHHTTVITWVRQVDDPQITPEVRALDELETFVGSKTTKSGSGRPLTTFGKES